MQTSRGRSSSTVALKDNLLILRNCGAYINGVQAPKSRVILGDQLLGDDNGGNNMLDCVPSNLKEY